MEIGERMQIIDNKDSATKLNNNIILGTFPTINNSKIIFYGKNNILLCEDGVILDNSNIEFGASNSIIFLRKSNHAYRLNIKVFNN